MIDIPRAGKRDDRWAGIFEHPDRDDSDLIQRALLRPVPPSVERRVQEIYQQRVKVKAP